MIQDTRQDPTINNRFVVFVDDFLSGWGHAENGCSIFAVAFSTAEEQSFILQYGKTRTDMRLLADYVIGLDNLKSLMQKNDHLSIRDRKQAHAWYPKAD